MDMAQYILQTSAGDFMPVSMAENFVAYYSMMWEKHFGGYTGFYRLSEEENRTVYEHAILYGNAGPAVPLALTAWRRANGTAFGNMIELPGLYFEGSFTSSGGRRTGQLHGTPSQLLTRANVAFPPFLLEEQQHVLTNLGLGFPVMHITKLNPSLFQDEVYQSHLSEGKTNIVFDNTWEIGEELNTTDKFVEYSFKDRPGFDLTLIPVTVNKTVVEKGMALYQSQNTDHTFLVIPIEFKAIFEDTNTLPQKRKAFKDFMYKVNKALNDALFDPEIQNKKTKNNIIKILNRSYEASIRDKRETLNALERDIQDYSLSMTSMFERRQNLKYELFGLDSSKKFLDETMELFFVEFDELIKRKKVKSVSAGNNAIFLKTNFLYFTNPMTNVVHKLGEMKIAIDTQTFQMTFKNYTQNFKGEWCHPHIHYGVPCYGNFGIGLPELLMQGRIAVYFDMIFGFLETINPDDSWGKNGIYWPIKDESKATEGWKSLKESRPKDYIMKDVEEPEIIVPKTDEAVLEEFAEEKSNKKKKKATTQPEPEVVHQEEEVTPVIIRQTNRLPDWDEIATANLEVVEVDQQDARTRYYTNEIWRVTPTLATYEELDRLPDPEPDPNAGYEEDHDEPERDYEYDLERSFDDILNDVEEAS